MDNKQADFLLYILGAVGLIVLFAPLFGLYDWKYGVFGAIIIWIIAGGYRKYYGIPSTE